MSIRRRSISIRRPSSGRSRREHARCRARRISTGCRATWGPSSTSPGATASPSSRTARTRSARRWHGQAGRHARRCRVLQLPAAEAAQHLRRRHGRDQRRRRRGASCGARARPSRRRRRRTSCGGSAWAGAAHCHPPARVHGVALSGAAGPSSFLQATPDVYLWEKIRPLDPLPAGYRRALQQRPGGDRPRGAAASRGVDRRRPSRTRAAMDDALGGAPMDTPGDAARPHARVLPVRDLRATGATRWCGAACGAASTSRACTSTCARGCRSSAPPRRRAGSRARGSRDPAPGVLVAHRRRGRAASRSVVAEAVAAP